MKLDDLVDHLTTCGLDEKEARAFVHLTNLGQTKVTELAKAAGLRRAEAYLVLDRLQSRGLVEATLTRPRLYQAVSPERAVRVLEDERERELKLVQRKRGELVDGLGRLGGETAIATAEGAFRILHDQNQIRGEVSRSLGRAEREVAIVTSPRGLHRLLLEGLGDELADAAGRGVKVRVLTEIVPGQEDLAGEANLGELRHVMIPRPVRFVLVDDREIVQYVSADPLGGGTETALWIGASDYVQAQRAFFDDMWKGAIPAEARLTELRTGKPPEQASLVRGRFTRFEKQKDMIFRASRSVDMVLNQDEVTLIGKSGLERLLRDRAADGVRVRVLHSGDDPLDLGEAVTRANGAVANGLSLTLVDGAETLLVFAGREAGRKVTALDEAAAWVTMAGTTLAFQQVFDALWDAAEIPPESP